MAERKKQRKSKRQKLVLMLPLAVLGLIVFASGARTLYKGAFRKQTGLVEGQKEASKVVIPNEEEEELLEDFPNDLPIYPDAKLASSFSAKGKETKSLSVVWETSSQIEEVSEYYKQEFVKKGWEVTLTSEIEESVTFSFEKGETSGFIGIATGEGKTVISVTLRVRK